MNHSSIMRNDMNVKSCRINRRKSGLLSYSLCVCCSCYFTSKNLKFHLNDKSKILPRVKPGEWFGGLTSRKISDFCYSKLNFIYIDPESFSICEFLYGEIVKVSHNDAFIYCYIFPSKDCGFDDIIGNEFLIGFLNHSKRSQTMIEKSPITFELAKEMVFTIENRDSTQSKVLVEYLKAELDGIILKAGDRLTIPFLMENLDIKVTSISNFPSWDTSVKRNELEAQLTSLSLNDSKLSTTNLEVDVTDSPFLFNASFTRISFSNDAKPHPSSSDRSLELPESFNPNRIAGIDKYLEILKDLIILPLKNSSTYKDIGLDFSNGVLLHGISGSGKTSIIYKLAHIHSLSLLTVDFSTASLSHETERIDILEFIRRAQPNIVLLRNLELIQENELTIKKPKIGIEKLAAFIFEMKNKNVFFVSTARDVSKISSSLRNPQAFDTEIEVVSPSEAERHAILLTLLKNTKNFLFENEIKIISKKTQGCVPADIISLFNKASHNCVKRINENNIVNGSSGYGLVFDDFQTPLMHLTPSVIRDTVLEIPDCRWTDIGGMESIKQQIRETVEWPWKFPESFSRLCILPPSGVLLYGPPGCSKTMIARALSCESGLNFLSVKGPELVNKYVGETERAIRSLFRKARLAAPCIIFFDEIDSFASIRNSGKEGSFNCGNRIIAQLLIEMDGISSNSGSIFIIAATNRPFDLDPALIRHGRFDRLVYVPPPDKNCRKEIFKIKFAKMPIDSNVDIELLVKRTASFTGAEIVGLCQEAAILALREDFNTLKISMQHFTDALSKVKPRLDEKHVKTFEHFRDLHGDMT